MTRRARKRPGAALITALALLLVMGVITVTVLNMRTVDMQVDTDAVQQLRARAAAAAGLQLAAWTVENRSDLQEDIAMVIDQEGDTWQVGSDALIEVNGTLAGATFAVEIWPRTDELRLRSHGTAAGCHSECWTRMPVTMSEEEETEPESPATRPPPASPFGP
ncbi:MAG: hypothetical protein JXO22_03945 [Phycisphaerae bacterium]|nr:hypothetical protein [Phycisphaerae bacterium]